MLATTQLTTQTLSERDLAECEDRAKAQVNYYTEMFGERGSGQYGHNAVAGNIIGARGEVGASRWLSSRGFYPDEAFEEFVGQKCDIVVNGI